MRDLSFLTIPIYVFEFYQFQNPQASTTPILSTLRLWQKIIQYNILQIIQLARKGLCRRTDLSKAGGNKNEFYFQKMAIIWMLWVDFVIVYYTVPTAE